MINLSLNQPPSQRLVFINFDIDAVMNTQYFEEASKGMNALLLIFCFYDSIDVKI